MAGDDEDRVGVEVGRFDVVGEREGDVEGVVDRDVEALVDHHQLVAGERAAR
ncbi:MAG: hypothetical protein R2713_12885 [Ilumatobacteraceae bacterium]